MTKFRNESANLKVALTNKFVGDEIAFCAVYGLVCRIWNYVVAKFWPR